MKTVKKSSVILISLLFVLSVIVTACSSSKNSDSPSSGASSPAPSASSPSPAASGPDNSKEVKLVGYLLGEAPKGMPEVMDALNAKLKKDINATLEINYIGWSDVASKYPLILASGEDVDFVFAADWNFYVSEATKGAFMPLDNDMLKKYMPKHMAKLPESAMKASQVSGKSYMIPTSTPDRKVNVALVRQDILDKAGLPVPQRLSELGPYFAEIKKEYPNMTPLNLDSQYDLPTPFQYLLNEKVGFPGAPFDSGDPIAVGIATDNEDSSGKIVSMVEEPYLGAMKYAAGIMNDWYNEGYVNKNPYANKIRSKDNFVEGKSGVAFGNSIDIAAVVTAAKEKGIEVAMIPMLSPSMHAGQTSWLNNGIAIAANSKNPERALQAIDLIMEDESYVNLVYFGIEGKNYVVTPDGKIGLPEGMTAGDNTYPPDAAGFWFVNKDYFKPMADWTETYVKHYDKIKDYLVEYPYTGFTFNNEKVKAQVANLKNVSTQYAQPIFIGAVKDIDQAFDTLSSKLNAAGIDGVKAEVEAQAAQFLKNKG